MKRRSFLKILSLAPAVAAVPAAAMAAVKAEAAPLMAGAATFFYRVDTGTWMGYAMSGKVKAGQQYEFASIFNSEPDEQQRRLFCHVAETAFQRAKRKYT